jgi:hypothetical protein
MIKLVQLSFVNCMVWMSHVPILLLSMSFIGRFCRCSDDDRAEDLRSKRNGWKS